MFKRIKNHYEITILSCIIFYISFLLFYKLWVQSFWIDEWYSSYVAKYMSLEWLYKSKYFLFEWLQALCFKIWWFTDFWARFPSVIAHIFSVLLMYLIPTKLCKNKYVWLFSALLFGVLYWELWRWRDARFYALLQCIFLLWMYLTVLWTEKWKVLYLNLAIILAGIWMMFHPFLYCLTAIIWLMFISQYKKLRDFKTLFSKKYLSTWILIIIWLVWLVVYWTLWSVMKWELTNQLSRDAKKYYFSFYSKHLWWELGIISVLWIIWMFWFILKKKVKEWILFLLPLLLFMYALVIRGYLMHSRYALLIFPLLILSSTIFVYDIIKLLKNNYEKSVVLIVLLLIVWFTAHIQILPQTYYYFDYTSPQPDFKSAYASIPDKSKVISWFPTLCDWYYSDRGECIYSIRVDLVHDWKSKIKEKKEESYTKIPYIDDISQLRPGTYYFVMDDLTTNSSDINWKLYKQISDKWKRVYDSWDKKYKYIAVMKVVIK